MIKIDFSGYRVPSRVNKEREAKEKEIVAEYKRGCALRPDLAKSCIMQLIADATGYKSYNSVRYILAKHEAL